jgi:peptidoglycan/LPS O-acetylase OafA/YrhL
MKRTVPLFITAFVGVVLVVAYFIPHPPFDGLREDFNIFFDIIASAAFILGGGNLIKMHGERISRRDPRWIYSLVTVASFLAVMVVGLTKMGNPNGFRGSSVMFGLLAFYVASASFRAFRAKNIEATILLVVAFVILLGRTFMGALLTSWLPESLHFLTIPYLAEKVMTVLNFAGNRAIMIGIALGIVSTSLKVIVGIDRSYLGSD